MEKMISVLRHATYRISRHVEVKSNQFQSKGAVNVARLASSKKWKSTATLLADHPKAGSNIQELSSSRTNTIFIANAVTQTRQLEDLQQLLAEHVQHNIVKIGKKFYRQKEGIPQGSILSSMLCNYFYAGLEVEHLGFLQPQESLLLRLIDDFLLVTTNIQHARKFLHIMHTGLPDYGVGVQGRKSLVNFEASISGCKVPRMLQHGQFPYCGTFIDTITLDVSRHWLSNGKGGLSHTADC